MLEFPILELREPLLAAVAAGEKRLIITAPTGSGKSTQIPQMLCREEGQVVVLQPRRLATRLLAAWVAQQRGVRLGEEVGYQMRFEDVTSPRTRIRYVTEGVLLRQMLAEPELRGVGTLVFDEFHERHLYGDVTLARALQLQETIRPDLLIVVMSATLDVERLRQYLAPCSVLASEGRTFPVQIQYLRKSPGDAPVWELAVDALEELARQHAGDALVFMPGAYEIQRTVRALQERFGSSFVVLPLHGELPPQEQDAAVARYERRKIVVATNVAETSLTIEGVRMVVDSGLARIPRYDPHRGINTLLVEKISRASADQRAGRAGRTAPGICLRLWTEREHQLRPARELPEIKRLDLAEVVLTLKAMGVEDFACFRWLDAPDPKALERAITLLSDLGALTPPAPPNLRISWNDRLTKPSDSGVDTGGSVTELGRRMLAFPLHPRFSRMLLAAEQYGCVRQAALIAAVLQGRDLLVRSAAKETAEAREELFGGETESDLFVLMRAYRYAERHGFSVEPCRRVGVHAQTARQAAALFEQFLRIAEQQGLRVEERPAGREAVQKCVLTAFVDHLARRLDAGTLRCAVVHGRKGVLARESVVRAPLFVATEIAEVEGREVNVLLSGATAVREEWLRELFPQDFSESESVVYDETAKRVYLVREKCFRDLVLESVRSERPPLEEAARLLAAEVAAGRSVLRGWTDAVEQWIARVNFLRQWMPELGLPSITLKDRQRMLEQICFGAASYKEIKDRPVWPVVKRWLTPQQQALLDEYAPERIELPSGRRPKITYARDGPPRLAAQIQDLYGVSRLSVANGRVPVLIEVLAPNQRPVQVTADLANFWKDTYTKLKQELQRKYPKHQWR